MADETLTSPSSPPEGGPPEAPATEPESPPVVTSWADTLPEDLRGHEGLKRFSSVEELAREFTKAEQPATAKPEDYTLPEGVPQEFRKFASDLNLSQGQVDAVFTLFHNTSVAKDAELQKALSDAGEAHLVSWGESRQENLSLAKSALTHFDKEGKLSGVLKATGWGNHPLVLEHFRQVGELLKEGGFIRTSGAPPQKKKTAAEALYPTMN